MATCPNRLAPQKPGGEMKEILDPKFIQFGDGEEIEGVLVKYERIFVNKKNCARYTVRDANGDLSSFLGTYQIDSKLQPHHLGHRVRIHCEGVDRNVSRYGNSMKLFRVFVSESRVENIRHTPTDAPEITDKDIPFRTRRKTGEN